VVNLPDHVRLYP